MNNVNDHVSLIKAVEKTFAHGNYVYIQYPKGSKKYINLCDYFTKKGFIVKNIDASKPDDTLVNISAQIGVIDDVAKKQIDTAHIRDTANEVINNIPKKEIKFIFLVLKLLKRIFGFLFFRQKKEFINKANLSNFDPKEKDITYTLIKQIKHNKIHILIIYNYENNIKFYQYITKLISHNYLNINFKNRLKIIIASENSLDNIETENKIKLIYTENSYTNEATQIIKKNDCSIDQNILEDIIIASNGNMSLFELLAQYYISTRITILNIETVINEIYDDMIVHLKNFDTIEIASVLGLIFNVNAIHKISNETRENIITSLNSFCEERIIKKLDNYIDYKFILEYIQELIYQKIDEVRKVNIHEKYAEYLLTYNPEAHLEITNHLIMAHNYDFASYQLFIYMILNKFNNIEQVYTYERLTNLLNYINTTPKLSEILSFINKSLNYTPLDSDLNLSHSDYSKNILLFLVIYRNLFALEYKNLDKTAKILEQLMCYFKEKKQIDMCMRIGLNLITIYDYRLGDGESAQKIVRKLHRMLDEFSDLNIIYYNKMKYKIKRLYYTLLSNDIALENMKLDVDEVLRTNDIDEKIKFATNYIGNVLVVGNYEMIVKDQITIALLDIFEQNEFLFNESKYKMHNNLELIKLYENPINKNIISYHKTLSNFYETEHSTMFTFNYASSLILKGNFKEAEDLILSLKKRDNYIHSTFYPVYFDSNLASIKILKGDFEEAKKYMNEVEEATLKMRKDFSEIFKERNKLIRSIIASKKQLTPKQLFLQFENTIKFGTIWKYYRKGILFSELTYFKE